MKLAAILIRRTGATAYPALATALSALAATLPAGAKDPRLEAATPQSRAAFVCLAYGEGFIPIPGTDTCVRAGGDLEAAVLSSKLSGARTSADHRRSIDAPAAPMHAGRGFTRTYGGAAIEFDSRTPTDYGSIDTHIRVENWQQLGR